MAKYYVSADRGSDTTGTGTASNPWKTINKAIGTPSAITLSGSGDTVYIEPGLYRELVTLGPTPSASSPLAIVGDCDGAGFAAGGYSTPATGVVDWRGWTDDYTVSSTATVLTINNSPYVTLAYLKIFGSTLYGGGCLNVYGSSNNLTCKDCVFVSHVAGSPVQVALPYSAGAWNTTFDRCDFVFSSVRGLTLQTQSNATEYSINALIRNCRFIGRGDGCVLLQSGGTGTSLGTGVTIQNCTAMFCGNAYRVYIANAVTMTTPIGIYGCTSILCSTGIQTNNSSMVAADYNAHHSNTPIQNGTEGAHSKSTVCPALDFGDARLTGLPYRPFSEPLAISPFGGFGAGPSPPSLDLSNRSRPEGSRSPIAACGALERHDTGVKDVVHQDAGSPACLALVGPSSQERPLLVDASAVTVRVKVRWDGNQGDVAKPQAVLIANPEIGVAGQTLTATTTGGSGSTPNAYETLVFAPITPTAPGVVMLRMISRAAAGNGAAYFDTITFS